MLCLLGDMRPYHFDITANATGYVVVGKNTVYNLFVFSFLFADNVPSGCRNDHAFAFDFRLARFTKSYKRIATGIDTSGLNTFLLPLPFYRIFTTAIVHFPTIGITCSKNRHDRTKK